jgi:hypothetical protein
LQKARDDAKADMTADDAARWLKQNGAGRVARSETMWINGLEMDNHEIWGHLRVSEESLWSNPMTAWLSFEFDAEWRFSEVKLEVLKYALH